MKKLHLGCGSVGLDGWVNIDIDAPSADVVHDLTQPLPFADASVSHIFSEHVIEHFEYDDALRLLRECRRVLAPDGVLRISTPDLAWLAVVYYSGLTTEWGELWQPSSPCMLLNEGMRAWGHKFLFDRAQLHLALHEAGFGSTVDCEWHGSLDPDLRGLESRPYHHDLIVEARIPFAKASSSEVSSRDGVPSAEAINPLLISQAEQLQALRSEARAADAVRAGLLAGMQALLAETQALRVREALQEQRFVELGNAFDGHRGQLEEAATLLGSFHADLRQALEARVGELELAASERAAHVLSIEKSLLDCQGHVRNLEAGLAEQERAYQRQLLDHQTHIANIQAALAGQVTRGDALQNEVAGHLTAAEEAGRLAAEREGRIADLQAAVGEERERNVLANRLAEERKGLIEELERSLRDQLASASASAGELMAALDGARREVEVLQVRCDGLDAELDRANGQIAAQGSRIGQVEADLEEGKAHVSRLEADLEERNIHVSRLVADLSERNVHINRLETLITTLKGRFLGRIALRFLDKGTKSGTPAEIEEPRE